MKTNKSLKNFLLEEDAKISKKSLLMGGIGVVVGMFGGITEAGHSSSPCGGSHSSSIGGSNHSSAVSHSSHSSY